MRAMLREERASDAIVVLGVAVNHSTGVFTVRERIVGDYVNGTGRGDEVLTMHLWSAVHMRP